MNTYLKCTKSCLADHSLGRECRVAISAAALKHFNLLDDTCLLEWPILLVWSLLDHHKKNYYVNVCNYIFRERNHLFPSELLLQLAGSHIQHMFRCSSNKLGLNIHAHLHQVCLFFPVSGGTIYSSMDCPGGSSILLWIVWDVFTT